VEDWDIALPKQEVLKRAFLPLEEQTLTFWRALNLPETQDFADNIKQTYATYLL
jgi:hypothetical protein